MSSAFQPEDFAPSARQADASPALVEDSPRRHIGANPDDAPTAARPKVRCCYCHRPIYKQRNGAWYHKHNASVSCKPGWGSNKATPGGAA